MKVLIDDRDIVITSGYRTEKQNKEAGGAENSYHLQGRAADVRGDRKKLLPKDVLLKVAKLCGFHTLYKNNYGDRIHVDNRNKRKIKDSADKCECDNIKQGL